MSAGTATSGREPRRPRLAAAALISLAAGMTSLGPPAQAAPMPPAQAALAASPGPGSGPAPGPGPEPGYAITAGTVHSCALEHGRAYCWGANANGELGNGSAADSSVPVAVSVSGVLAGKTLTQIAASGGHVCALDSAGAAFCWGSNDLGQLGDGSTVDSSVPVAVSVSGALAGKTLTQITAGNLDTCAVDSGGAAFCWGWNDDGELGDASTASSSVPVAVHASGVLAGQTLTQITSGLRHTCAVGAAGAAFCWGNNDSGQLGNGTAASSSVPVAVTTTGALAGTAGKTLTQISAGEAHTCALDAAGAAFCWGDNTAGGLGAGGTAGSAVPVAVQATGVLAGQALTQISAGALYTCAVDAAGAAFCWGDNTGGLLGNGNTTDFAVPSAVYAKGVLAGQSLTQISAGGDHTCAGDAAGALYCWGQNSFGDLGNNAVAQSVRPVLTGPHAPAGVTAAAAGSAAAISWQPPASLDGGALTGYTATAAPGGEKCSTAGATACTITGLTGLGGGTIYEVTVVAHTTVGDSGASAPAVAAEKPTGPIVSGDNQAKCVDDARDSAANRTKIVLGDCNGMPEQTWVIEADGTVQANGKCMDITRQSKANGALVELYACNGGANQQWRPGNGTLVNPVSGKCLDDPAFNVTDGTQLDIWTCNRGANQQWILP